MSTQSSISSFYLRLVWLTTLADFLLVRWVTSCPSNNYAQDHQDLSVEVSQSKFVPRAIVSVTILSTLWLCGSIYNHLDNALGRKRFRVAAGTLRQSILFEIYQLPTCD